MTGSGKTPSTQSPYNQVVKGQVVTAGDGEGYHLALAKILCIKLQSSSNLRMIKKKPKRQSGHIDSVIETHTCCPAILMTFLAEGRPREPRKYKMTKGQDNYHCCKDKVLHNLQLFSSTHEKLQTPNNFGRQGSSVLVYQEEKV